MSRFVSPNPRYHGGLWTKVYMGENRQELDAIVDIFAGESTVVF